MVRTASYPEAASAESPSALSSSSDVIDAIEREHHRLSMLVSILKEQLDSFSVGKTPDYRLMLDVVDYMRSFPVRFDRPQHRMLCERLLDRGGSNTALEMLMAEKSQLLIELSDVQETLTILLHDNSLLKQEQLKVYAKALIENIARQIKQEASIVIPRARTVLTSEDWNEIQNASEESVQDPLFGQRVEERYRALSDYIARRVDEAADDLTMAEFLGMGMIFDSIEPLSKGVEEISGIVKSHVKALWQTNLACYKSLLKEKQHRPIDYVAKPLDCLLDSYDCYVDGLIKVGEVLRKTRSEISEPYTSRIGLVENEFSSVKKPRARRESRVAH